MGFKMVLKTVEWRWNSNDKRHLVPDLWSCRREDTMAYTSAIISVTSWNHSITLPV